MSADTEEFLWRMYSENTAQGRHHEVQRSNVTGFMLIIGTALVGIVTFDKTISGWSDAIVSLFLMGVGLFGAAFTVKHYERFRLHMERAAAYRHMLDSLLPNQPLILCKEAGDRAHAKKWPRLKDWHTTYWWAALNLLLFLLGATLFLAAALTDPPALAPPA